MNQEGIFKPRVNGFMLNKFVGKCVVLVGFVGQVDNDGRGFKLKACDNVTVSIQLENPLEDVIEGLVEVQGIVTPRGTVVCKDYVIFPKSVTETFDANLYNEAVLLMARKPELFGAP